MTLPRFVRRSCRRWVAPAFGVIFLAAVSAPAPAQEHATRGGAASPLDSLLPGWLVSALRTFNPDLVARRAALAAAEARASAAGFAPAAVLSAELEDAPRARLGESSVRVGVERELLTGARRAAVRAAAATEVRAAEAALRVTEQRAAAVALRALVQAIGWRAVASRLAAQDSLLSSAEGSLRSRFSVGEARYVDVLRLRTERLRVQTERATTLTEARAGGLALVALVGGTAEPRERAPVSDRQRLDSLLFAAQPAFARGALPSAPDVDSLLSSSGLVALADAEVAQAMATRQLLVALQRPQVIVGAGVQHVGGDGGGVGPTVVVSVSLPFTARKSNAAALRAADRGVEAAAVGRRATLAGVRGALAAARDKYEAARARLAVFDAALLRGAREERESALTAYRTGELSLLELLDFERALSNAEIERTRAIVDAAGALADLYAGAAGAIESLRADLPPIVRGGQ